MKKQHGLFSLMILTVLFMIVFTGCPEPEELSIISIMADDIVLSVTTPSNNIPVDPQIVAEFSTDLNPETATSPNIKMVQDYDLKEIDIAISVSGNTITISPVEELGTGILYQLSFSSGIKSNEGEALIDFSVSFTTGGNYAPAGAIAHWTFEDSANDIVGSFNSSPDGIVDITYTPSRNAAAGKAATFNGVTSIIEIPNGDQLIDAENFTLSFWFKTNSAGHVDLDAHEMGHYVLGLAIWYGFFYEIGPSNTGYQNAGFGGISFERANGFPAISWGELYLGPDELDSIRGGPSECVYVKTMTPEQLITLVKDAWLHVALTFKGSSRELNFYYNGEKMKTLDFDNLPDDDNRSDIVGMKYTPIEGEENILAFGFFDSRASTLFDDWWFADYYQPYTNHFKGQLDDVRIYHKTLTPREIELMYESEKP
jgi:hypothetical protein